MKKIIVRIHKGQTTVTAEGYQGASCKDATSAFEKALGNVIEDTETPEMHEEERVEWLNNGNGN